MHPRTSLIRKDQVKGYSGQREVAACVGRIRSKVESKTSCELEQRLLHHRCDDVSAGNGQSRKAGITRRHLKPDVDSNPTDEDVELLRRVALGDKAAFAELYDRLSGVLYSTVMRILNDSRESEDVLQEVFLQIWDKANTYDSRVGRPFNWALTITRNRAIDRLRSVRRRYEFVAETTETALSAPSYAPDAGREVYQRERSLLVRKALEELPLEQRQAIEMAFLGGQTQNEISEQLGQPLGTIKARIRRGMLKLRESLGDWL